MEYVLQYLTGANLGAALAMALLVYGLEALRRFVLWEKIDTPLEWLAALGITFVAGLFWMEMFMTRVVGPTLHADHTLGVVAFGIAIAFVAYGVVVKWRRKHLG